MIEKTTDIDGILECKGTTLLEAAPYGAIVASTRLDGRCVYINPAFSSITGYGIADIPTIQNWLQCAYPDAEYRALVLANWSEDANPGNMDRDVTYKVRTKEGLDKQVQFRARMLDDEFMLVMLVDVTEVRRLEQRIQKAQQAESLSALATGAAHDFSNMLVGVLGHAELALCELDANSLAREDVDNIRRAAKRAGKLVQQLLAYAGKIRMERCHVDICSLVKEIIPLVQASHSPDIDVKFSTSRETVLVDGDPTGLRLVVMNLLNNAFEAMGDSVGAVSIEVLCQPLSALSPSPFAKDIGTSYDRCCVLRVRDTGCGIDEETLVRVFDPFFGTKPIGHGIGLAAVRGVVDSHKGVVTIDSVPGEGTFVEVMLPSCKCHMLEDGSLSGASQSD